jgi:hypothetical protein
VFVVASLLEQGFANLFLRLLLSDFLSQIGRTKDNTIGGLFNC